MMFDNFIGGSQDPQVVAKNAIIDELRAAGASDNFIRGVMANVQDESGFNPGSRHWDQPRWTGEPSYAHGLYQEGAQEWINYDNWLKQNYPGQSWTDPTLQTRFLGQNLKQNYPSLWNTMNAVRTPEEAAQAFVSGYLKPREDLRLQRVAAYGKGVPDLDHYLAGAGTPANMSQDDQLVRSIGTQSGSDNSALTPSTEDRLSSAMTGGKGTAMPPVLQIQQQTTQAPVDLMDEGPSYKQLADALLAAGQSMGRTARTPWEALGSMAQIASGTYQGEKAKAAEKDYTARLMAALQSGGGDANSLAKVLVSSSDPDVRKAGLGLYAKSLEPKAQEWAPLPAQTDAYGRPMPPLMVNKHSGEVRAVGASGGAVSTPQAAPVTTPGAPVSAAPAAPLTPARDAPTVVRSETYLPDGTKVETPAAAPPVVQPASSPQPATVANPFAMVDGSTAPVSPATPVPASSPVASPQQAASGDEYDWRFYGVPKMPGGTSQITDPKRGFAYFKGTDVPVPISKAEVESRQRLAEKKADQEATTAQGLEDFKKSVETARSIQDTPGFEKALKYNSLPEGPAAHIAGVNAGLGLGGLLRSGIAKSLVPDWMGGQNLPDRNDPMWTAKDRMDQTTAALKLAAMGKLKGFGQIRNPELQMIDNLVANIGHATGPADYAFKLNALEKYIQDQSHAKSGAKGQAPDVPVSPSGDEMAQVVNSGSDAEANRMIAGLAEKYRTKPQDMTDYIARAVKSNPGAFASTSQPVQAAPPQPKMQDRISPAIQATPSVAPSPPPPAQATPAPPSRLPKPPLAEEPGVTAKPITTKAEFDALPSKAIFIAPDGTVRRKP